MTYNKEGTRRTLSLNRAALMAVCLFPAVITVAYYALRGNKAVMDWAARRFSSPIRELLGLFSSLFPFSLMEVLAVATGICFVGYIAKTIATAAHKPNKLTILSKCLLTIAVCILYAWSLFCWLWNSGYHAPGFAQRNGFTGIGITPGNLAYVARIFADKANELAVEIARDDEGNCILDRRELLSISTRIYENAFAIYPELVCRLYKPKPMMFSWLMSRTGYTGVYFALTGESSINTRAPIFLMPSTIAHELAHQCGIFAEDEANFVGILACITSGSAVYEYAGYLTGLMYLRNALPASEFHAWVDITENMSPEVRWDLQINYDYWQSQKKVETGVEFLDSVLTTVSATVSEAVNTAYDGFLKSQDQELGLQTYGACVDLLVEYFAPLSDTQFTMQN